MRVYFGDMLPSYFNTYRPIVTARVSTHESGNIATTLNLIVENFGNRPAKNIKLSVDFNELESALLKNPEDIDRKAIERCFLDAAIIPICSHSNEISRESNPDFLPQFPSLHRWRDRSATQAQSLASPKRYPYQDWQQWKIRQ